MACRRRRTDDGRRSAPPADGRLNGGERPWAAPAAPAEPGRESCPMGALDRSDNRKARGGVRMGMGMEWPATRTQGPLGGKARQGVRRESV